MSALTRAAASSFSFVSSPSTLILTGPAAGNVSLIVSAWNLIAASASTVEYTPQAPSQGSVRSSYLNPRTSNPLTNVSAQSLRLSKSLSTKSMRSSASIDNSSSSISSAMLALNPPFSVSPPGIIVTSTLPSSSVTMSGFTISISRSALGISPTSKISSSIPIGAGFNPFSIAISKIHFLYV